MYLAGDSRLQQRILVVDDESPVLTLLTRALEREGYETISNMDGGDVLETIRNQHPELVILDINLPTMNGFEVCRQTREVSQVPIIMISSRNSNEDKVLAFGVGADDYITKRDYILDSWPQIW